MLLNKHENLDDESLQLELSLFSYSTRLNAKIHKVCLLIINRIELQLLTSIRKYGKRTCMPIIHHTVSRDD